MPLKGSLIRVANETTGDQMDTRTGPVNNADKWSFENGVWRKVGDDDKYQVPIRHFSCGAFNLHATTSSSNAMEIGPLPPLQTAILGRVRVAPQIGQPSISLMDDQSVSTRELNLEIRSVDPDYLGERKKVPLLRRIEFFSEDDLPNYTADLGYIPLDLETDADETWYITLYVAPDLFNSLLNSLRLGRVHELTIRISFADLFVKHPHVPLQLGVDWYLGPGKTAASGWLDGISWREVAELESDQFSGAERLERGVPTSENREPSINDRAGFSSLRTSVDQANKSFTRVLWVMTVAIALSLFLK